MHIGCALFLFISDVILNSYLLHKFILRKNTYSMRLQVKWYMYSCTK